MTQQDYPIDPLVHRDTILGNLITIDSAHAEI